MPKQTSSYVTTRKRRKKRSQRRKLKPWIKKFLIRLFIAILIAAGIGLLYKPVSLKIDRYLNPPVQPDTLKVEEIPIPKDTGIVRVNRYRDLNEEHLKYAKAKGINSFSSNQTLLNNVGRLVESGKLVLIADNENYVLKELTHSHPYLTPDAARLLNEIGKRYAAKLGENGLEKSYFQVSSLLRTDESQKKLSRSNSNASSNSSHLYATTFDISYKKVVKAPHPTIRAEVVDGPAMKLLSETIGELRKEGRCLVATERREACFHITVK